MNVNNVGFFTALPRPMDSFYTLIRPFDTPTWTLFAAFMLGFSLLLALLDYLLNGQGFLTAVHNGLSVAVAAMLQESLPDSILKIGRYDARTLALAVWLVLSHILASAYRSNLLSHLAIKGYERPVETIDDILASKLPLVSIEGTVFSSILDTSKNPKIATIRKESNIAPGWNLDLMTFISRQDEIFDRVAEGKLLTMGTKKNIGKFPQMQMGKESFRIGLTSWVYPKRSRVHREFSPVIRRLFEAGILDKFREDTMFLGQLEARMDPVNIEKARQRSVAKTNPLDVPQFYPVIIVLGFGFALSVLSFFGEILVRPRSLYN